MLVVVGILAALVLIAILVVLGSPIRIRVTGRAQDIDSADGGIELRYLFGLVAGHARATIDGDPDYALSVARWTLIDSREDLDL